MQLKYLKVMKIVGCVLKRRRKLPENKKKIRRSKRGKM